MFTILNIINYFTGKYIPLILLILITVGIYYYIISYCFDDIFSNDYYKILLLILMLLDITSLIVIFVYENFLEFDIDTNKSNKKVKKDLGKKKVKKNKKEIVNIPNEIKNKINNNPVLESDKEIISLYDNEKLGSIHTYII
jgi:hypothetical protein